MDHRFGPFAPLFILVSVIGFIVTFGVVAQTQVDVLSQLGIQEKHARSSILDAVWYGEASARLPGGQSAFKAAPPDKRAAFVRAAAVFAKAYVNSSAFKQAYADSREGAQPKPPAEVGTLLDDGAKERKKTLEEMRQNLKTAKTAQEREIYTQALKVLEETDKMMSGKDMQSTMAAGLEAQHAADQEDYQTKLKKFESNFPKDPNVLVARRLKEFLAMSATVDFGAQTVKKGSLLKFVNAAYEDKPEDWKLCYRAGKDAVDAARAVATEWLKEIRN